MYHSFLIHSSADGHLGCFHVLPGSCKQCCDEHWGTRVSFISGFLGVYAQKRDCWVTWQFYFQFFKESPLFFMVALLVCIPTNSVSPKPLFFFLSEHMPLRMKTMSPCSTEAGIDWFWPVRSTGELFVASSGMPLSKGQLEPLYCSPDCCFLLIFHC